MAIAELSLPGLEAELAKLITSLKRFGDLTNAQILDSLSLKLTRQECVVACCGYVSGGKSKLLNLLTGEENLLPVSPLPSSINTLHIRPGKMPGLKIRQKDASKGTVVPHREQLQALCQDPSVEHLELTWDFPGSLSFIDTPGIDSIESANQLANNPALLLADLVVYVTDYNHVQSQVNFSFLKSLQTRKIPYLLIVNQIDKHVSLELSLADFRSKLKQALDQWDLAPVGLYFTSLLGNPLPECQLNQLKEILLELGISGPALLQASIIRSVKQVLARHSEFFSAQQEELRAPYLWVKDQEHNEQELVHSARKLETEIAAQSELAENIAAQTMLEINKLLDNAPLFNFETRELARHVLESRKPGFKAGFFSGAAKTKQEQEHRLQKLYSELVTRSEANLTWHLRKILSEIPSRYGLSLENYEEEIAELNISFPPDLLLETVRPGAVISGEYLMNYTHDLAVEIKSIYRQKSLQWIKRAQDAAKLKCSQELLSLQGQLEATQKVLKAFTRLRELDALHTKHMAELTKPWEQVASQHSEVQFRENSLDCEARNGETAAATGKKIIFPKLNLWKTSLNTNKTHPKLWKTAQALQECAELVTPLPGFTMRVDALQQRASRLENNLFTVALFGAFSAGKSSLANAMLGDTVLPVSPNPTTAAINKILPPTEQYPHGTIKVKIKTLQDLTTDVQSSLTVLGNSAQNLEEALRLIPAINSQDIPLEAKPHQSFLQAVSRGDSELLKQLGNEITVEYSEFRDFVVQEEKACFVEWIELYYACPLTEMGVVLVDTPGSNSTNARHTNVSFEYIKSADAVLFVTYYNNPFCKADAQFLSQLGKVKDTFAMDKMFFLINAADLAQTPEELGLVKEHVEKNLRFCEIIRPRIFPVSSQLALLAKLSAVGALQQDTERLYRQRLKLSQAEALPEPDSALTASGLKLFETAFYSFIEEDLINLAVESAEREISGVAERVDRLLEAANTDAAQKVERLQLYQTLEQRIHFALGEISVYVEEHALRQEIDELLYYVNQRISHRFSDFFSRSFIILAKPKEEQPKLAVNQCIRELTQDLEIELYQEMRATSLRVERFVQTSLKNVFAKQKATAKLLDPQCSLANEREFVLAEEPKIPTLSWNTESFARIASLYKNPKDWVEGLGRTKMGDALLKSLQPQILEWLEQCALLLKDLWTEQFILEITKLSQQTNAEVSAYYSGMSTALGQGFDTTYLKQVRDSLAKHNKSIMDC